MSDKRATDKTRAALKSLEPWADDEIDRLEKTFAAHRRSDDIAASGPESRGSIFAVPFGVLTKESFASGFLLGLISGLALWALVTRF